MQGLQNENKLIGEKEEQEQMGQVWSTNFD